MDFLLTSRGISILFVKGMVTNMTQVGLVAIKAINHISRVICMPIIRLESKTVTSHLLCYSQAWKLIRLLSRSPYEPWEQLLKPTKRNPPSSEIRWQIQTPQNFFFWKTSRFHPPPNLTIFFFTNQTPTKNLMPNSVAKFVR